MASWYRGSRAAFLAQSPQEISGHLHESAASAGWQIDPDQDIEWRKCVETLQRTLAPDSMDFVDGILLEYDFRRRGLRIDCVLSARGALFIVEFKRGVIRGGDQDQVMNYCVNLVEFHELTQRLGLRLFPIVASRARRPIPWAVSARTHTDWPQICLPVSCAAHDLAAVLLACHKHCPQPAAHLDYCEWDQAAFSPASTIVDAAISLWGAHDVSAIKSHAAAQRDIERCINSVVTEIASATHAGEHRLIAVSGTPGAGKTLVGLSIAFDRRFRNDAVYVTGNTPLVDVLNGSLQRSYRRLRSQSRATPLAGYSRQGIAFVEKNTDFKIVKAHRFLHRHGSATEHRSTDGRILVFDEAQRTYAKGKLVHGRRLEDHEAHLIIEEMQRRPGSIIVLLIGHNQHINFAELGAPAWLGAAERHNWKVAIADETLELSEFTRHAHWRSHELRRRITDTHLTQSIRAQRTSHGEIEQWAHFVMSDEPARASTIARSLPQHSAIRMTRCLKTARYWVNSKRTAEERSGIIASGQGLRLRPDGVFADEKPDIVPWMLEPTGDVRSSNMLEQAQNQYQIQGLEIDYAIVCWDGDLRREKETWACYKIHSGGWSKRHSELETRLNSYRVLLTRSRKGMVVFIPAGDRSGEDPTREHSVYDGIAEYLEECGALYLGDGD